jgi:hypothetical protein
MPHLNPYTIMFPTKVLRHSRRSSTSVFLFNFALKFHTEYMHACMHVICVDSSGAEAVLRLSVTPLPRVLPSVETGLSATCVRVGPDRTQDLFALRFLPAGS